MPPSPWFCDGGGGAEKRERAGGVALMLCFCSLASNCWNACFSSSPPPPPGGAPIPLTPGPKPGGADGAFEGGAGGSVLRPSSEAPAPPKNEVNRDDFPAVFFAGTAESCCSGCALLSMAELPPNAMKNLSGPASTAGADFTAGFSLSISASAAD